MWEYIKAQPIRFFALIFLVAASIFLGYFAMRLVTVLESYQWCGKAIQADRITPGNTFVGLVACLDILKLQVPILGTALHYVIGGFVLGMLSLIIIVVAKAKGSFKGPGGIGGELSPASEPDAPPTPVVVTNPASNPVPTTESAPGPRPQ